MEKPRKDETISSDTQIVTRLRKRYKEEEEGENYKIMDSSSLPLDLIIEILVKLPPKSIGKLLCVSKLWYTTLRGRCFIDLFLTRSLTRPCLLFTFRRGNNRFFHTHEEHSLSSSSLYDRDGIRTTLDFEYKFSPSSVRGLICCRKGSKLVICNPTTGQVLALPKAKTRRRGIYTFLGYDSVEDVHKVLFMTVLNVAYNNPPVVSMEHQVLTLRQGKKAWRMIECKKHPHCPATRGLYKDDVIYYGAWTDSHGQKSMLMCFDVRLEEFGVVKLPEGVKMTIHSTPLDVVNYRGKVTIVEETMPRGEFNFWILEDVEKQEWSKTNVVLPSWKELYGDNYYISCIGTISTGEIVFSTFSECLPHPFFVVYYDPERNYGRRVVFPETTDPNACAMVFFLDHVKSLMLL